MVRKSTRGMQLNTACATDLSSPNHSTWFSSSRLQKEPKIVDWIDSLTLVEVHSSVHLSKRSDSETGHDAGTRGLGTAANINHRPGA